MVRRYSTGQLEQFQVVLGCRGCPWLSGTWTWAIRVGGHWPGVQASYTESCWGYGFWIVGFQLKGLLGESFTLSRNWLNLGRAVCSGSARTQMSKCQKHMVDNLGHKANNAGTEFEPRSGYIAVNPYDSAIFHQRISIIFLHPLHFSVQFAPISYNTERRVAFCSCQ